MQRNKRDRGPIGSLEEEWTRVSSIAALDRLLRYVRDEASALQQRAVADLIDNAINALPGAPSPATCEKPQKRERRFR